MNPVSDSALWLLPLLAALSALAGLAVWILARGSGRARPANVRRRFSEAFDDGLDHRHPDAAANWLEALGNRLVSRGKTPDRDEVKSLLARAGWKRKTDLPVFFAIQTLLPVIIGLIASETFFVDGVDQRDWSILFIATVSAWLLPKRFLAYLAAARQRRIAEQTPILIHLLRILLSTGLSVEQCLRSLSTDTRDLLPDIANELDFLLRQIDAGDDISLVMRQIALNLDVPAFTDLTMILEQTWRMGGSVLKSLTDLSNLVEERMQTDLKEKVSKLSAKMTVVMMLFLFPALLVFLAAPGFLAIIQGLKNAGG
ncbi:MAG: type secretion system domain protein [Proteobacteria bacterium]|nr:type secretion system domain protein [Pseudomonadota bacterium]